MFDFLIYVGSFITLWLGAGLIINSVDKLAKNLKISSFAVSFFVLGLMTSIPETSVGLTAVANNDPEIFVGTLLGGVITMFLLVIPILAMFGNGIKIQSHFDNGPLLFALFVALAPSLFVADKHISKFDGVIMVTLYAILFLFMKKQQGVLEALKKQMSSKKINHTKYLINIVIGVAIVYFSSNIIVSKTMYFAEIFHVTPFLISLLILSIGTNLPELSIAIKSVLSGKKDIAFGDYIGSAAANTLLFGILSLLYDGEVNINGNFYITFFFIAFGLGLFYYFSRSKRNISRKEGFLLFCVYLAFLGIEVAKNYLM